MIRIYNKSNISLMFISPYTDIRISEEELCFHQVIFDTYLKINCPCEKARLFMDRLSDGVSEDELLFFLGELSGKNCIELLNMMIRIGILE